MARTFKDNTYNQPRTRSGAAIAMHMRGGKGAHGGSRKQVAKRDRAQAKHELREFA